MKINPNLKGQLPKVDSPEPFADKVGRLKGWRVKLPGGRPLATPAVVGGRVFLGGGFGSYDFYALDAATGRLVWQRQTQDDGPTAAVIEDGLVVFNTESCELEVLTADGERLWSRWLGDPLMSIPAAGGGRVYMAYPDTRGDGRHYLACFDLRSGEPCWRTPLPDHVVTAPVLAGDRVYVTTLDGTVASFQRDDGAPVWQDPRKATSSPAVWDGHCYFSQREEVVWPAAGRQTRYQSEHLAAQEAMPGSPTRRYARTGRRADYLDHTRRVAGSPAYAASAAADFAVGMGHYGARRLGGAAANLGRSHVHAVWAYQGSKPFVSGGRVYGAVGDTVYCLDARNDEVYWKKELRPPGTGPILDHVLTPPALANGKVFLGATHGRLYCLSAAAGDLIWDIQLGEPVVFQPAVAGGRVFAASSAGSVYGLETGDPLDDGWPMWGGGPGHNGPA